MSTDIPSAADQLLLDHAHLHGLDVTAKMLEVWRSRRLLPGNIPGGGLGRGKGSTSSPAPESFDLVLGLARHAGRGKRPTDLALLLFAEGLPVPEQTVRAAFNAAVDTVTVHGDDEPDGDPDQRLDDLADHIDDAGLTVTLVPARARRIDEGIARLVRADGQEWPPAELAAFDENPGPSPSTPKDAALAAAAAVITGSMSLEDIGDMLRAMNPTATAHPIASLVETTRKDVPEVADTVLTTDGHLALGPVRDARDHLHDLSTTTPLEDLARAWTTAERVRQWALDLCTRVEEELATGRLGEAVGEWQNCRYAMAGLDLLSALKQRDWPPAQHALDTLLLLYQLAEFQRLDHLVPGCHWHLLDAEGMMPPPTRELLQDLISRNASPTPRAGG
ncbi:hypothetical protein PV721_24770 [Streptomyces sp. MB09-01]|uniref:hypothetical protein n=1 Tax=Streptomyces sp. MB09-01 TaxID=3028666 RepID=UPI0029BB5783|nr:hypothetical protein [Streptomyces sp. MB09-01]MDX3537526.1 hypothetical protein [Streptomyces sp. MB09-01]